MQLASEILVQNFQDSLGTLRLPSYVLYLSGSYSIQVAIMENHRLSGLNNKHLFLAFLEAENPRSRSQQFPHLVRVFFLVCRWLSSSCVLIW